jgi:energy-coupling factor transport system substrate-specific component
VLYGVFSWVTNWIALPAAGSFTFRPAVAIPMFFGVAFGPIVGFVVGFLGNVLVDLLSGPSFHWHWDLGNGLMGFIPGLMAAGITSYKDTATIIKAEILVVVAVVVSMLVPSLLEIPLSDIDFHTAIVDYWFPVTFSNAINGLVLVPILMVAYDAVVSRSGR